VPSHLPNRSIHLPATQGQLVSISRLVYYFR